MPPARSRPRSSVDAAVLDAADHDRAPIEAPGLDAIRAAQARNAGGAMRTPLVRLHLDDAPAEIYLKLESLQPIGSFKLRGAGHAMAMAEPAHVARGAVTASVGNMAVGVAWNARRWGVPCHVVVPDTAPDHKIAAIEKLDAVVVRVSFDEWWRAIVEHEHPGLDGYFVHPVSNPAILAGNGTIGLEILEDLPDVDAIVAPFGGGGLSCGIACAARALGSPAHIHACEVETAAPLAAALVAGKPTEVTYTATFVEGVGGRTVLAEMWPLAERLLAGSAVVTVRQVAEAVRLLAERARLIVEGAAATTVAAVLSGQIAGDKIVCVISGGNLGADRLTTILRGEIPSLDTAS